MDSNLLAFTQACAVSGLSRNIYSIQLSVSVTEFKRHLLHISHPTKKRLKLHSFGTFFQILLVSFNAKGVINDVPSFLCRLIFHALMG